MSTSLSLEYLCYQLHSAMEIAALLLQQRLDSYLLNNTQSHHFFLVQIRSMYNILNEVIDSQRLMNKRIKSEQLGLVDSNLYYGSVDRHF
jgi:hypothetical protein